MAGIFLFAGILCAHAAPSKDAVIQKYEKAIYLAEELNVYQQDVLHVVPKIQLAVQAILRNDFTQANRLLDDIHFDLKRLQSHQPMRMQRVLKLEWLQIYQDIIQKYAALALLAFFFIRIPYFRRRLYQNHLSATGRVYIAMLAGFCAVFFSFFDIMYYGESAWAFLDIQVIWITIGGLLGGFWAGLFLGMLAGALRLMLSLSFFKYFAVAVLTGVLSGMLSRRVKNYHQPGKIVILAGLGAGLVHGALVYLPFMFQLPWSFTCFSILFVALLEAVGIYIFFAMTAGILREDKRKETENELLKTQFRFLQAQINPHFIYNALNTISAVCGKEGSQQGQHLTLQLADFMRGTLKRLDDLVTLKEEMEHLDAYLEIEKVRFQDRLQIEKKIQIPEPVWKMKIPFLILQPLVENAIKHGISPKEEGGKVTIGLRQEGEFLQVEIRDDGVGMNAVPATSIKSSGIGIQNVNQRLKNCFGEASQIQFTSEPGKGTLMYFKIKVKLK